MPKSSNKLIFNFGDRVVEFKVGQFEDDLDLDKILKIDYGNLFAEIVTFPIVVNRFGLLAAEMDNLVRDAKADLAVFEAKKKNEIRDNWDGPKKPTVDEVESELLISVKHQAKSKLYSKLIKEKEFMYTIYQSAKDKSEKLNKLSLSIRTGDVDEQIIQNQLNSVYFKIKKGRISDED